MNLDTIAVKSAVAENALALLEQGEHEALKVYLNSLLWNDKVVQHQVGLVKDSLHKVEETACNSLLRDFYSKPPKSWGKVRSYKDPERNTQELLRCAKDIKVHRVTVTPTRLGYDHSRSPYGPFVLGEAASRISGTRLCGGGGRAIMSYNIPREVPHELSCGKYLLVGDEWVEQEDTDD